jgi:hypothetical protein
MNNELIDGGSPKPSAFSVICYWKKSENITDTKTILL